MQLLHKLLEIPTQQAVQGQHVGKVLTLAVGDHFHMAEAAGSPELDHRPVAMGQGIDEILVDWPQLVVAHFPV